MTEKPFAAHHLLLMSRKEQKKKKKITVTQEFYQCNSSIRAAKGFDNDGPVDRYKKNKPKSQLNYKRMIRHE